MNSGSSTHDLPPGLLQRLQSLGGVPSLAVALRCVTRAVPTLAADPGSSEHLHPEQQLAIGRILRSTARWLLRESMPDINPESESEAPFDTSQVIRDLFPRFSTTDPIPHPMLALAALAEATAATHRSEAKPQHFAEVIAEARHGFRSLDPESATGAIRAFDASLDADLNTLEQSRRGSLAKLGMVTLFIGNPLWKPEVPPIMTRLLETWGTTLQRAHSGGSGSSQAESLVALVQALWTGELPIEAFLPDDIPRPVPPARETDDPLPRILALPPAEIAHRLVQLAARERKLLPHLATPTRATLESLARSHGRQLLETSATPDATVADPLWIAWYSGSLARVVGNGPGNATTEAPTTKPTNTNTATRTRPVGRSRSRPRPDTTRKPNVKPSAKPGPQPKRK